MKLDDAGSASSEKLCTEKLYPKNIIKFFRWLCGWLLWVNQEAGGAGVSAVASASFVVGAVDSVEVC